jgi:5-methylcytosine-specific restriction endonuclease McrA
MSGQTPWNKGLRNWRPGYRHSRESRVKIQTKLLARPCRRISAENELARKSVAYKEWRSAVFARDEYRCQACGSGKNIQADHIQPFARFHALRYELSNGRTLCAPCHRRTPTYGNGAR